MDGLAVAFDPFDHFGEQAMDVAGPIGDAGHPQGGRLPEILVVHLGDGDVELVVHAGDDGFDDPALALQRAIAGNRVESQT